VKTREHIIFRRFALHVGFFALLLANRGYAAESAKQLLAAGRVDDVVHLTEEQIARSPNDAEAHNLLCRAYFSIEQWDAAITACEHAVALDSKTSVYHLWLGRAYGEKADRSAFLNAASLAKKARVSFELAVELDPKNVEARADLGEFYAEAPGIIGGGKDKSRQQADALMPLNPAMGHWVLARIAEKDKDAAAAEREYRAEIEASHSGVRGWLDLANFFKYAHRYEEMEEALRNLEATPVLDRPESLLNAGSLLLRAERNYPLAIRLLRRYLTAPVEEGPASRAHDLLGLLLEKQGDRKGAAEQFRAALALAHSYKRAEDDLKHLESAK
jgi:tetratricopeptide (TPR) repeat protein